MLDGKRVNLKDIVIPREELDVRYSRSSGAGGQHVNKTNTKADVRFHVQSASWLSDDVKKRLTSEYSQYLTDENWFMV